MYTWMNKWAFPCEARTIGRAVGVLVASTGGVTGLGYMKSLMSRAWHCQNPPKAATIALVKALSGGCQLDRQSDGRTSLSLKPAVRKREAVTILISMIWRIP